MNLTVRGPQDFDRTNVKQLKCYLINTALEDLDNHCGVYESPKRFPREPFPQYYTPSTYTLHTCGKARYHTDPWNMKRHYDNFGGWFHDFHWWPGYRGFGVKPGKFSADADYCMPPVPVKHFDHKDFWYLAPHTVEDGENKISVYFPAEDQFMCGAYKLVVVAVVYESGWGRTNLHTYTIDYGEVFSLVEESDGLSGNVTLDVDVNKVANHVVKGFFFDTSNVFIQSGSSLTLNSVDLTGSKYVITVKLEDGTEKIYTPDNWFYDTVEFSSGNDELLSVTENGTLIAGAVTEDTTVTVYVMNKELPATRTSFEVTIKAPLVGYMGFSTAQTTDTLNFDDLQKVDSVFGVHYLTNELDGSYLWICSTRKISDVTCSHFDVPLEDAQMKDGYFCYKCPNALKAYSFDITVE